MISNKPGRCLYVLLVFTTLFCLIGCGCKKTPDRGAKTLAVRLSLGSDLIPLFKKNRVDIYQGNTKIAEGLESRWGQNSVCCLEIPHKGKQQLNLNRKQVELLFRFPAKQTGGQDREFVIHFNVPDDIETTVLLQASLGTKASISGSQLEEDRPGTSKVMLP